MALFAAAAAQIPQQHCGAGPPADQTPGATGSGLWQPTDSKADYKAMAMVGKGQVHNLGGRDMKVQAVFLADVFAVDA